jgi:hypothetical protein
MTKTREEASEIRKRLRRIPAQIAEQVELLLQPRAMMHGYVYHSPRRCGRAGCHCARGELHDAWVVATSVKGKRTTRSLQGRRLKTIRKLAKNYRSFRRARSRLRGLWQEALELSRQLERLLCEDPFAEEQKR